MVRPDGEDRIIPESLRTLYLGLKVGICAPSLCEQEELNYIVKKGMIPALNDY